MRALLQVVIAFLLFAGGACIGVWFNQHYRIVPADAASPSQSTDIGEVPAAPTFSPRAPAAAGGDFSYRFSPNETLNYDLTTKVTGSGSDGDLDPMDIGLDMAAALSLVTQSVDAWGNGALRLQFDTVDLSGEFMGMPVAMRKDATGTHFQQDPRRAGLSSGAAFAGIPQLEFFNQPIDMLIAPNGEVKDVGGPSGFDQLLLPPSLIAAVEFPSPDMAEGYAWESNFSMPVPGLGSPVPAKARNRFTGYADIRGRRCAVIEQEIGAAEKDGKLFSPESVLGGAMSFAMPEFKLGGHNVIYFDVDNGHLVHSDINLDFGLKIGPALKGVVELLGLYGQLLDEIEGRAAPRGRGEEKDDSQTMEIGVRIAGTLALRQ